MAGLRTGPRRIAGIAAVAAVAAAALAVPALAAGTNLLKDAGFERPVLSVPAKTLTAGQSIKTCFSGARGCWLVNQGSANLTGSLWTARAGAQSLELNGGTTKGEVEQAFSTTPGTSYVVTFWMSADPAATDNVGLQVAWEDIDVHGDTTGLVTQDFTYFDPTHTAAHMHWQKHSFVVPASDVEGRLFFLNTSGLADPGTGPAIDAVSVRAL
jgi:hypothetical protein